MNASELVDAMAQIVREYGGMVVVILSVAFVIVFALCIAAWIYVVKEIRKVDKQAGDDWRHFR